MVGAILLSADAALGGGVFENTVTGMILNALVGGTRRDMKIAIVGTRGIPNKYGGFEQFAERLSCGLVERGHEVTVYNPHWHSHEDHQFEGVRIVKHWCPENVLGAAAHFFYDYLCLRDAARSGVDVVLECGYQSSAPSMMVLRKSGPVLVTNMDGLEWRRDKWGALTKKITLLMEKWAVRRSDALVADNGGIAKYLDQAYGVPSVMIPYGANIPECIDTTVVKSFGLVANEYFLLIARLEPENNIETIVRGYLSSESSSPLCIVGGHENRYGALLKARYPDPRVRFLGGIYDQATLDGLRFCAAVYFHGHSVGGTNPSLLEAMASQAFICAHDNEFNRSVLGESAQYFNLPEDVAATIRTAGTMAVRKAESIRENIEKVQATYPWKKIIDDYERLFLSLAKE